ncbi:DUF4861 family protein [Mariniflexile sp. HNIBRBA6329]|uniref:DUF4861 family protein n=1 Tax=Mariniflexile sp. HNIBRBA6329 TaxID=3373088 RepID=UPI00374763DE
MFKKLLSRVLLLLVVNITLFSCNDELIGYRISVTNPSGLSRKSETVEVKWNELSNFTGNTVSDLLVKDERGNIIFTQFIDSNLDSIVGCLLFQADFKGNETKIFTLVIDTSKDMVIENSLKTFCRSVPERIDDFAWENDKVAFRTYGPRCQEMFQEGTPGGLISSGIDCWLKRVDYLIIDKWYKKELNGGSYHNDDGEGLDNYHVGTTRGCGGTALISDEGYVLSENYAHWKIIANGPIRSIFELEYPAYKVDDLKVTEIKRFTIDLGANFYRCDVKYACKEVLKKAAVGITHHNSNGMVNFNTNKDYFTYWESLDDSFLGTAVILDTSTLSPIEIAINNDKDNNWINFGLKNNSFSYWSGFGWNKAGNFSSLGEWNEFVEKQSRLNKTQLSIKIEKL